jgi:hypothetical protein
MMHTVHSNINLSLEQAQKYSRLFKDYDIENVHGDSNKFYSLDDCISFVCQKFRLHARIALNYTVQYRRSVHNHIEPIKIKTS